MRTMFSVRGRIRIIIVVGLIHFTFLRSATVKVDHVDGHQVCEV